MCYKLITVPKRATGSIWIKKNNNCKLVSVCQKLVVSLEADWKKMVSKWGTGKVAKIKSRFKIAPKLLKYSFKIILIWD